MLPTRGYFQDIDCPDTNCARSYCHFRHRRRPNENTEEDVENSKKNVVPTYKPTPKSELASIQNKPSHIPISYVPDLAYNRDRTVRPIRIDKPTYKPTPLSVLSSAGKPNNQNENVQENVYDPSQPSMNLEELATEFELLDSVIQDTEDPVQTVINVNLTKIEEHIEKEQEKLSLLQSVSTPVTEATVDKKEEKTSKDKKKESKTRTLSKSDKEKHSKSSSSKLSQKEGDKEKHKHQSKSPSDKISDKTSQEVESTCSENSKKEKTSKSSGSKSKKHKSKERSRSISRKRSRHKSPGEEKHKSKRKRSRSRSKHKDRSSKSKSHDKDKKHSSSRTGTKKSDSDNGDQDSSIIESESVMFSDTDLEFDNEEETMEECYKIFNEYKPQPVNAETETEAPGKNSIEEKVIVTCQSRKRTAHAGAENSTAAAKLPQAIPHKPVILPGQMLANRYKIAKMNQAKNEQEHIFNEVKANMVQPVKRLPTSLLEAARLHKMKRLQKAAETPSSNVVDDILNGTHKPSTSQAKALPKKIAAVPNVALIEKARERISLVKQRAFQNVKTIAQSQKGGRTAHIPEYSLNEIPDVLQAEKSKLPVNVRTRFLTMLAEECFKLYALKEDAHNRALNEEFTCYEKCKVLATYRNSAMLAVNRLRKEIQDRESKGLGPILSGESVFSKKDSHFQGRTFYESVKKWMLTDEELNLHGYPRESGEKGRAVIKNRTEIDYSSVDENRRRCSRCGKMYQVDDDGWALYEEECLYHPLKKRTIRGEQIFLCCKSSEETGCAMSDTHVFEGLPHHLLEGYQTTLPPESKTDPRSMQVYALDCEMCYTTKGLELTRVTIVDTDCKTVYESLVKPLNPIIDYNTRFSGITKEQMDRTSTSILQVQANILHLCNSETILVGHSLESDMKALKIVHGSVIDTSVMFPHKMGLPHKKALRILASEHLKKIIQNDVEGHDSAEDAVTCMELIKWKLKEDSKVK